MLIAGPCGFTDISERESIIATAQALTIKDCLFRCKIFMGGTRIDKWFPGVGYDGLETLEYINKVIPAGTEVQTPEQLDKCGGLSFVWVGARNSSNYGLLHELKKYNGMIFIKRGFGQTIIEYIDLIDLIQNLIGRHVWLIERGITTIDRDETAKYALSINPILKLKYTRPELFARLVVDCSHSTFNNQYVGDVYAACRAIGVLHYMMECTIDGKSKTDQAHMLSVKELREIIK